MIYDKNQFFFNVILTLLLMALIGTVVYFGSGFSSIVNEISGIKSDLSSIDHKLYAPNYIQSYRNEMDYTLTPEGFFVNGPDDFGTLRGASMQPTIFEGNTLIEIKYSGQNLRAGDIVRYENGSNYVIHRIRAVYNDTLHVQGDNLLLGEFIKTSSVTHIIVGVLYT